MKAPTIAIVKVQSSQLAGFGYDAGLQCLAIEFPAKKDGKPGDVYHYVGVPRALVQAFYEAPSKGTFFARAVRGKFETFKIVDGERVPLASLRATAAQVEYMVNLAKRGGFAGGLVGEHLGMALLGVARACGVNAIADMNAPPLLSTWLASLSSTEAGLLITELKARAIA